MRITAEALLGLPGIVHGFFTRRGGVSDGLYASLNCGLGSDDSRESVLANRARAVATLGLEPDRLATPHQIHSADVAIVDEVWAPGEGPRADAVVTARPGVAVGVGTADCSPVLFADPEAAVVGAAHAGWKGAFTGVLEATVEAMERLGARREAIVAALGPTISKDAYEVGPEFRVRFLEADTANEIFFASADRPDHYMFDLPAYIASRLNAIGLARIEDLRLCTYADPERFFSYRRTTHAREPDYGRLLSAIAVVDGVATA